MQYATQGELQRDVMRRLAGVEPRLRMDIAGLTPAQLAWNPPEGGWSIAQVFEHLCVTDEAQFPKLERVIRSPGAPRKSVADPPWQPRWAGRLIANSLTSPRKSKSPSKFRIGPNVRPQVTDCLFSYIGRMRGLMEESGPLDWRRVKLGSAALALIRYNLGDVWLIETVHLERHAGQIERVKSHPQFATA